MTRGSGSSDSRTFLSTELKAGRINDTKKDVIMSKIRLDTLEKNQLDARAMNAVKGGKTCGCACAYVNTGGSSSSQNEDANFEKGLWSPEIIDCKPAWWYNESDRMLVSVLVVNL